MKVALRGEALAPASEIRIFSAGEKFPNDVGSEHADVITEELLDLGSVGTILCLSLLQTYHLLTFL